MQPGFVSGGLVHRHLALVGPRPRKDDAFPLATALSGGRKVRADARRIAGLQRLALGGGQRDRPGVVGGESVIAEFVPIRPQLLHDRDRHPGARPVPDMASPFGSFGEIWTATPCAVLSKMPLESIRRWWR